MTNTQVNSDLKPRTLSLLHSQSGVISVPLGVLVVLIAIVVVVIIEFVVVVEDDPYSGMAGVGMNRFTPLQGMNMAGSSVWEGTLSCDALGGGSAFERGREVVVSAQFVALERGETDEFVSSTDGGTVVPRELNARFEWWRGQISGDKVSLEGWYTEGNDYIKTLRMSGRLTENSLYLEGVRGPRNCRFEANAI